jgi:cell division protein FtsL
MSTAQLTVLTNVAVIGQQEDIIFPMPNLCVMFGLFLCLLSAISLLYVKDLNRRLFIDYQRTQKVSTQLATEQEKLLLEQSAWSTAMHVQRIAQNRLDMEVPDAQSVVMLKIS